MIYISDNHYDQIKANNLDVIWRRHEKFVSKSQDFRIGRWSWSEQLSASSVLSDTAHQAEYRVPLGYTVAGAERHTGPE